MNGKVVLVRFNVAMLRKFEARMRKAGMVQEGL